MAPRDKKGILFILRAVVQIYLFAVCVHSRLTDILLRFNLDNKFQRGGGTESYVREQTLENQSRQLPESALSSCSLHFSCLQNTGQTPNQSFQDSLPTATYPLAYTCHPQSFLQGLCATLTHDDFEHNKGVITPISSLPSAPVRQSPVQIAFFP